MSFIKDKAAEAAPKLPGTEGRPKCQCGKGPAGLLSGTPVEGVGKIRVVMHFTDECLTQELDVKWWALFNQMFIASIQNERVDLAQQLACVVNASGGQVRFNIKEEMERGASHKFKLIIEPPDAEGFVTIRSPASRIVLATTVPGRPS